SDRGFRSLASVPLRIGGALAGYFSVGTLRAERQWPEDFPRRLMLLGGGFANALALQPGDGAMRGSEARFRRMAAAAPLMGGLPPARQDGHRTYVNQRWLHFTGRPAEDELGDRWLEGIHPDDRPRVTTTLRAATGGRRHFTLEYRLRSADGSYRWILDHGVP